MIHHDFDKVIDRRNTNSIKYDFSAQSGMPENVLPMWVADMDFKAPQCVIDALVKRSNHGIFGYSESDEEYFEILKNWFQNRFEWSIEKNWLVKTPGVVFSIATAVRSLTEKGDHILIQQPVYYPFSLCVLKNDRRLVINELLYIDGSYKIDFEDFEKKIIENNVKMFILCNPHNPVGRVWTRKELELLGDICLSHNVIVISDEIHQDFIYSKFKHTVFSSIKEDYKKILITCTAPSKTFNLAGIQVSNIFIPNGDMRKKFKNEIEKTGAGLVSIMGIDACAAAYKGGAPWLDELKVYLESNLKFIRTFLSEKLPHIKLVEPEGTYLIWLDFSNMNMTDEHIDSLLINKAGLWLDTGKIFGIGGEGFQRMNIACPLSTVEIAMSNIAGAFN